MRLYSDGRAAFARVATLMDQTTIRLDVRAFIWRDDETGQRLAAAALRAADRGVQVHIEKDRVAAAYELSDGTHQSLFHTAPDPMLRAQAWLLRSGRRMKAAAPTALGAALHQHPNVTIERHKRFDHAKVYVFDERRIMLGGMGIGDAHRDEWVDFMVEVDGPAAVARLREREAGAPFDASRSLDFLLHRRALTGQGDCPLLHDRVALLASATQRVVVAMAYLGDPRLTRALVQAAARGVAVTLLTSGRANLLTELNRRVCRRLQRAGVQVVFHPKMVHAKAVVIDGARVDLGSANFTRLSHGVYDEVNLYSQDVAFAKALEAAIYTRCAEGTPVSGRVRYKTVQATVERGVVAFQARRTA